MTTTPVFDRPATDRACAQTETASNTAATAFDGARTAVLYGRKMQG